MNLNAKITFKIPKPSFRAVTSVLLLLVVVLELAVTADYLYKNSRPQTMIPESTDNIIKANLSGYNQIYTDLNSREIYVPQDFDYQNPNPFKFGP